MEDIRRHLEGRPIVARGNETAYRMTRLARRHRTPLLTGAAAIAAVVLLNSKGVLFSREASDPTLMAMRSIALRDRIVVADFANFTTDSVLAAAITEAFRTDLSQSPVVVVMTPRQVRSSLTNMRQSPEVALSDSLARELALRQGVKAIVTGSLTQISGTFTINVQLVAARSGEALAAVRESAADSTKLIDAVDRASKALRQRIGESLRDLEQMPSLQKATTASLPALRMYSEAQRLALSGNRTAAIQHFERSIALDTGFASAHVGLSMAYGAIGDEGRSFDAAEHALANRERLPFLERSFLVASRAYSRQEYETAIRAYNTIVERFPENIFALNNLALAHRDARQFAVAESLFRRAARADTTIANFLFGLHNTQILQGKFAEGAATLDTLQSRFPNHPVYLTEVLQDAAAQQDWRRAELTARKQIEEVGADTLQLVDPYEALAQIAMARGRLAESERLWETHAKVSRAAGVMSRHLFGVLQRGYLTLRYRNDAARAVAFVDSALRVTPLDRLLPADRRYDEVARFYLAAGQPARAGPLLAAAVVNDSTLHRTLLSERFWTRGLLALTSGRVAAAIDTLRLAADRHVCPSCVLPDLGRAYERAGRLNEASTTYQRYLTTPWTWRYEPDAVELGWTLWRLADVSERLGDATRARSAWSQLLSLWDDADPAMLATIDAARARLQRLGTR
jgi:tetratricopeptide (TPR) repeat protein